MSYLSDNSKWQAYKFNDPFAADKFLVCNKITRIVCRPNCDLALQTNLKHEVVFVGESNEAQALGFNKCQHCLVEESESHRSNIVSIDIDLLIKAVESINAQIGFIPPLLNEDEDKDSTIKDSILKKSQLRRGSVPAIHLAAGRRGSLESVKNTSLGITKNESDHVKLVDLACRHIALAAACAALNTNPEEPALSPGVMERSKKRRRRGGVLGFKELAAKSRLSPWHFHRVFKSVTGLTPKAYGDRCWDFIKKYQERYGGSPPHRGSIVTIDANIANPTNASNTNATSRPGSVVEKHSLSPTSTSPTPPFDQNSLFSNSSFQPDFEFAQPRYSVDNSALAASDPIILMNSELGIPESMIENGIFSSKHNRASSVPDNGLMTNFAYAFDTNFDFTSKGEVSPLQESLQMGQEQPSLMQQAMVDEPFGSLDPLATNSLQDVLDADLTDFTLREEPVKNEFQQPIPDIKQEDYEWNSGFPMAVPNNF